MELERTEVETALPVAEEIGDAPEIGESPEGEAFEDAEPVVAVRFNKQPREMPLSQAGPYVEMGLKYESMKPELARWRYAALLVGKTLPDMIEGLLQQEETQALARAVADCGGNEDAARELHALRMGEKRAAVSSLLREQATDPRSALRERLAAEWDELARECPEVGSFSRLPDDVVRMAAGDGVPLLDAYLRFRHREERRVALARAQEDAAAGASPGGLRGAASADGGGGDFARAFRECS